METLGSILLGWLGAVGTVIGSKKRGLKLRTYNDNGDKTPSHKFRQVVRIAPEMGLLESL
jgi:hypothetical protein